jgi:YjjG family noncanonical pyrimidine nucleotidase
MKYRWLMFDADGTLFDYDKSEAIALETTFKQIEHPFESGYVQEYRLINEAIWRDFEAGKIQLDKLRTERFRLFLDAINSDADCDLFAQKYTDNISLGCDLMTGAEEIVRQLHNKTGMLIITNGPSDMQRSRISKSTIAEYFNDIVISDEVGASKPDSRIFDEAFNRMSNPRKDEVLIIGDSLTSDMKGGNDYGIDTCWFNPSQSVNGHDVECKYEIARLNDLIDIVL